MFNTVVVQCIDCKRRKIRLIEVNAKCHLKNFSVKGLCGRCIMLYGLEINNFLYIYSVMLVFTLRHVFIIVDGLEIDNFLCTFSHVGIFDPACYLCTSLLPFPFSLVQLSPFSCVILYTYIMVLSLIQIKICYILPLQKPNS
jgi:hypothetical protein